MRDWLIWLEWKLRHLRKPWCPVCGGRYSLPRPALGNCARCFNHMLKRPPTGNEEFNDGHG